MADRTVSESAASNNRELTNYVTRCVSSIRQQRQDNQRWSGGDQTVPDFVFAENGRRWHYRPRAEVTSLQGRQGAS